MTQQWVLAVPSDNDKNSKGTFHLSSSNISRWTKLVTKAQAEKLPNLLVWPCLDGHEGGYQHVMSARDSLCLSNLTRKIHHKTIRRFLLRFHCGIRANNQDLILVIRFLACICFTWKKFPTCSPLVVITLNFHHHGPARCHVVCRNVPSSTFLKRKYIKLLTWIPAPCVKSGLFVMLEASFTGKPGISYPKLYDTRILPNMDGHWQQGPKYWTQKHPPPIQRIFSDLMDSSVQPTIPSLFHSHNFHTENHIHLAGLGSSQAPYSQDLPVVLRQE